MATPPAETTAEPLIAGLAYCLGDDVTADDILAPEYLSFDLDDPQERRWLGAYALAHVGSGSGTFVEVGKFQSPFSILIAGRRFGRGSARIHSPLALALAGVRCVAAESISREFMRAAVNGGYLYCCTFADRGSRSRIETGKSVEVNLDAAALRVDGEQIALTPLGATRSIVDAGGLAAYLKRRD